jgi:hypothetical protein
MTDTATPLAGPVDAPASIESVTAEFEAGGEAPAEAVDTVVQELVNEAEGKGEPSQEEPTTEDDATDPAETPEEGEVEAEEPEEAQPDEQSYTVKVNGEERTVPLSELLNGYSRTEDYKAKTAEVAEQRRNLEAKATTIEADVKAHYANQLEEATNAFAEFDPVLQEARKIDWNALKATDPAAFVQAQDAVQARLQQLDAMKAKVATAREESQQQLTQREQQERETRFNTAAEKIVEAMPELADEAKFADFASTAIAHLKAEGFEPAEIAESLDHRVLKIADDARRWRAHVAAQAQLPQKKIVPKSAVKPLTTDGAGSRASAPRFNPNAPRDRKADWVVNQLLSEE